MPVSAFFLFQELIVSCWKGRVGSSKAVVPSSGTNNTPVSVPTKWPVLGASYAPVMMTLSRVSPTNWFKFCLLPLSDLGNLIFLLASFARLLLPRLDSGVTSSAIALEISAGEVCKINCGTSIPVLRIASSSSRLWRSTSALNSRMALMRSFSCCWFCASSKASSMYCSKRLIRFSMLFVTAGSADAMVLSNTILKSSPTNSAATDAFCRAFV